MDTYSKLIIYLKSIKGVGYKTIDTFVQYIKDYDVFDAYSLEGLKDLMQGINNNTLEKIYHHKSKFSINSYISKLDKISSVIINHQSLNYPKQLQSIDQPPKLLHKRGTLTDYKACVSIIGSRNASTVGLKTAYQLGYRLAQKGYTVVSGMAKGIDAYAHYGAVKAQGETIAVLGSGIDVIYPKNNTKLYMNILKNGCVISEFLLGTQPKAYNFPRRNRIIAALSHVLVVVEASHKSGTLITVNYALRQGKEIYAVPGNIFKETSKGVNMLLRDGAHPLICIDEFIDAIDQYYLNFN